MDAVISFVDMNDIEGQKDYYFYCQQKIQLARYRDGGFLKYVLRGIQYNMPFIKTVHLILACPSQIPAGLNINAPNLHIVYHKDFIPKKYLPTFNSNTIELFLHKIPNLSEQFLYINDDMIPINPSKPEDYFVDKNIVIDFVKLQKINSGHGFYNICLNSNNVAKELAGIPVKEEDYTYRVIHTFSPMFKSINEYVNDHLDKKGFDLTCTRYRMETNLTQYLYVDYLYHINRCIKPKKENLFKHITYYTPQKKIYGISNSDISIEQFNDLFNNIEQYSNICINDNYTNKDISDFISISHKYLDMFLNHKSIYEL